MQTYTFEAKGRTVTVEAANRLDALGEANRLFDPLPQGAWMPCGAGAPNASYWAEGNFFD